MKYAQVILEITHEKLDRIFDYRIPVHLEESVRIGMQVKVPFGAGNSLRLGYVTGISEETALPLEKIKEIDSVSEQAMEIEGHLVALAAWLREAYGGTMIQALKAVLPVKKKERAKQKRQILLRMEEEKAKEMLSLFQRKHYQARVRVLKALLENRILPYELAIQKLQVTSKVLKDLEVQGILEIVSETVYRNPAWKKQGQEQRGIEYNEEQKQAVECFCRDEQAKNGETYLLQGVTGSGKTEVYLEMIRHVVRKGEQAIVLIPEIALTYQTVMRFRHAFGERISILNSRMSQGERYDQLMRAKRGELDVMVGPRSALFTPFPNLGLIVIDEEHEPTYKSEQVPRYHARETAVKRGELEGARVVLGSATPSLEASYLAREGRYKLLTLNRRVECRPLPIVHMVDMREEMRTGNHTILSQKLRMLMEQRLEQGQQVMLFLNRRGYAGFVACRGCGYVLKCPHCDVSLSSHRGGRLVCHYCGYETNEKKNCPQCGSRYIGGFRAGTQQIEEQLRAWFPKSGVLRMDLDSTRGKEGHEKVLSSFREGEAQILLGTQMIVKGHDFPGVTLVGILAADLSLYGNDYRSAERTFQLLTQAAGRAGRGNESGEVVIQTYSPEHYAMIHAAKQDYEGFYQEEMAFRMQAGYPPAGHLLAVMLSSKKEAQLEQGALFLKKFIAHASKGTEQLQIIGPSVPYVGKIKDIYRQVLYLKSPKYAILIKQKNYMEQYIRLNSGYREVYVQFDFDPLHSW